MNLTNNGQGVLIAFSTNSTVENVNVSNTNNGIRLVRSSFITVKDSVMASNSHGIFDTLCSNNTIVGNQLLNNGNFGVAIAYSNDTTVTANLLQGNKYGIIIDGNPPFGGGMHNVVYHNNFINNTYQIDPYITIPSNNTFDNGYPSGGNYWSDYSGVDDNGDGIGDTPYFIDANNQDRYPLMNPWGTGTPVTSFTWTPSIQKVGEFVTFDASYSTPNGGEIVSYEWNFGDEHYGSGKTVTHTYTSSGIYTVTLNVTDSEGLWDIEQKQIQVVQPYGPIAEFTATPETTTLGESVKFDASASQPGWNGTQDMPVSEYRWDFGGGIKITTSTPILYYSFISPGIYYVTLTVYAPGATPETDTISHKVTIISVPVGGYSFPIKGYTTMKSLVPYLALLAILTASLTMVRRKTHRRAKRP